MWRAAWYIGAGPASLGFILRGVVDWSLCVALAAGLALGSYLGSEYGLKKGEAWVRSIVLAVVFGSAIRLVFL